MDTEKEKEQKKAEIQEEILLAALKLFAEKGFFNTSLTDIKDAAGFKTTSSLYQHFKNKQTIANAIYNSILESLDHSIDDIRKRNKQAPEQLREIVDLMFVLTEEAPDIMRFLLDMKLDEFLPEEKQLIETEPFKKIIKIFDSGIKNKEIRTIEPLLAYGLFFGVINQILRLIMAGALVKKMDAYQSEAWMSAWNTISKK